MSKRVLAILLTLTMLLGLLPMGAVAAEAEMEETSQNEGSIVEEVSSKAEPETEEVTPETAEPEAPEEESASNVEEDLPSEEVTSEAEQEASEAVAKDTYEEAVETYLAAGTANGTCGDNLTWTLNNGTLAISGTGAMTDYDWDVPWDSYCVDIQIVKIGNGVTSIGSDAFYGCSSLTSITIPSSVTSIGRDAFYGCTSLTGINVAAGNTMFCSVNGVLFDKNTKILYTYPSGKSGGYSIPSSVTTIGDYAFISCSGLTRITIPGNVTTIGAHAFSNCDGLTSITIPNSVTSIGASAFSYCDGLTSITIPGSVTTIGHWAFADCDSLTNVTIQDGVTTIEECAFLWCSSLANVTIPNSVTSIEDGAFNVCDSLTNINVASGNNRYRSVDGVLFNKDMSILYQYPAGKSDAGYSIPDSVTTIGAYAFYGSDNLTSVTIPNNVASIGDSAFQYCYGLTNITIPNSMTSIKNDTFFGCHSLASVTIPSSVTSIGDSAFQYCYSLTGIAIPSSVTTVEDKAFFDCSNLTAVYYSGNKANWGKISIGDNNSHLINATIYYNAMGNVTITSTNPHISGNILYWSAVADAELYQIFRRTPGQPFEYLRCASGLGVKDETAKVGVTYIYAVRAVNGDLRSADYSNQVTLTRPSNIPANVKITKTNPHKTGNILYWNGVSGAKFYQIFRRTSGKPFEWLTNTGGAAYKDETAKAGTQYIYAIKAHNGSVKSAAYSNQVTITRPRS